MILVLGILAILLLVTGIALIFKSYGDIPDPGQVVPVAEVSKLRDQLDVTQDEEQRLKLKLDELVVELEKTRARFEGENKISGQEAGVLRSQVQNYESKVQELVHSLEYLRSKADQQAQEAVVVLTSLQQENENLKLVASDARNKFDPQLLAQLQTDKASLEEKVNANLSQAKVLEHELAAARNQSAERVKQAEQAVTDLAQQNEILKQELSQVGSKISETEAAVAKATAEKDQELKNAQAAVEQFKSSMQEIARQKTENDQQIRQLLDELEATRRQIAQAPARVAPGEDWGKEKGMLEKNLTDLKDLNTRLLARERMLQQELTKSRAQAMGLEKICTEFKNQLNQSPKNT